MEDNLKYKKVKFNLDPTGLLAVDQYDGLNFKETGMLTSIIVYHPNTD